MSPMEVILKARTEAPNRSRSIEFDAWFLESLVHEFLSPGLLDVLLWLSADPKEWMPTEKLCTLAGMSSSQQMGSTVSKLRILGLIETKHEITPRGDGRCAYHRPVAWVRMAQQAINERNKERS